MSLKVCFSDDAEKKVKEQMNEEVVEQQIKKVGPSIIGFHFFNLIKLNTINLELSGRTDVKKLDG